MSETTSAAQSSAWQGGRSEILVAMTVMVASGAGYFSEQNVAVWDCYLENNIQHL